MVTSLKDWDLVPEERTSGIYAKASTSPDVALAELREITGEEPVAVLLFATEGRPPAAAAYPPRPKRLDQGYSLTHRLSSWLHAFTRTTVAEVPAYVSAWFPERSVIVVPICTPDWEAGVLVVTRACAKHAAEIRSLAADLALRLEISDRRTRLDVLRLVTSPR